MAHDERQPLSVLTHDSAPVGRHAMTGVLPNMDEDRGFACRGRLQARGKLASLPGRTARIGCASLQVNGRVFHAVSYRVIGGKRDELLHFPRLLDIGAEL